eukprot:3115220-Pleurochrysis_carterae.AAC.1
MAFELDMLLVRMLLQAALHGTMSGRATNSRCWAPSRPRSHLASRGRRCGEIASGARAPFAFDVS